MNSNKVQWLRGWALHLHCLVLKILFQGAAEEEIEGCGGVKVLS